jgi:hypothetical protein
VPADRIRKRDVQRVPGFRAYARGGPSVVDSGPGFAGEHLARIFDTTKPAGEDAAFTPTLPLGEALAPAPGRKRSITWRGPAARGSTPCSRTCGCPARAERSCCAGSARISPSRTRG